MLEPRPERVCLADNRLGLGISPQEFFKVSKRSAGYAWLDSVIIGL